MKLNAFAKYAWVTLGWNVLVILWGAYVRAVGAGAGCGNHWPSCNGQVIPLQGSLKTLIEFTHRATSGVALLMVAALLIWAWRAYAQGHRVRTGAMLSAVFIVMEALLGAGLVLFKLVEHDESVYRAVAISVHLVNTLILLACLTLTAWWATGGFPLRLKGSAVTSFGLGALAMLVLGMSGAIAALGDTLFPAASLAEGLAQDFSPRAHVFLQLRAIHPFLAMAVGLYLVLVASWYGLTGIGITRKLATGLIGLVVIQWLAGLVNVLLLAPVWMQMLHLLLADSVWVLFVLLGARVLGAPGAEPVATGVADGALAQSSST
jgi:heme A synthase